MSAISAFWSRCTSSSRCAAIVSSGELSEAATRKQADAEARRFPAWGTVVSRRPDVCDRGGGGQREKDRLEREVGGAHACRQARVAHARAQQEEREGAEHEQLLDHHHDACELLVGARREPVGAVVERIERVEREDEHVRQHLADGEHAGCQRDASAGGEPPVVAGIDQERPHEQAGEHPAGVLEVVQVRVKQRVDVEPRDVPDRRGSTSTTRTRRAAVAGTTRTARTSRSRATGPSTRAGTMKKSSGPRTAKTIRAMPRSPISTCWSMCTQSRWCSPIVSIGEMIPASTTTIPAPKIATRLHGARSGRPRRRSRSQPFAKSAHAMPVAMKTDGGAVQAA